MANENDNLYWINGVKIVFPLKAYGSQISIMSSVTRAIKQSKNCLIESPTGTGKTLALLCSSLAWVEANNNTIIKEKAEKDIENNKVETIPKKMDDFINLDENENSDFISSIPLTELESNVKIEMPGEKKVSPYFTEDSTKVAVPQKTEPPLKERAIIYYCTRTHYQISQVISELKRTKYNQMGIKMSILSSRKLSCINPEVKTAKSISDACKNVIKRTIEPEDKCDYFNHVFMMDNHVKLRRLGIKGVWDIEDFVEAGKYHKACPYFSSQKLAETSDIVFAPYNYILNPLIAQQMKLSLRNNILIFDEAHNIEDVCRAAMSAIITYEQFLSCYSEFCRIVDFIPEDDSLKNLKQSYYILSAFSSSLANWTKSFEAELELIEFDRQQIIFNGPDIKEKMKDNLGIDFERLKELTSCYAVLVASYTNEELEFLPKPSEAAQSLLSSVLMIFEHLAGSSADQFVISIQKGLPLYTESTSSQVLINNSTEVSLKPEEININMAATKQLSINFICLSPSLAFQSIRASRSIILASGTLSPMASFSPELGSAFDICFQALNHLQPDQVAVYSLSVDSKNNPLRITFKNLDSFKLQDELGLIVLDIIKLVPYGVLCFLPSYTLLEKLIFRWRKTYIYKKMEKVKHIFIESKGMTAADAEEFIEDYFKSIYSKNSTGALLFAVCRGRISEGVDFSDEKARAVIAIGIPYPNIKVVDVERKMLFNDKRRHLGLSQNVLSGRQWYNIQAYRALNQALGRCIRHKNDWGAIILIDERFDNSFNENDGFPSVSNSGNNYLSPWIRNNLRSYKNFESLKASLASYISLKPHDIITNMPRKNIKTRKATCDNNKPKKRNSKPLYNIKEYFAPTSSKDLEELEDFIFSRSKH